MPDAKKCKKCGACTECGASPQVVPMPYPVYPVYPIQPLPQTWKPYPWVTYGSGGIQGQSSSGNLNWQYANNANGNYLA